MNNIDYREIVQTVTSNVLSDVKSQLASMQPGIVDDIVKRVQSSLQPTLNSITNQLGSLQQRVAQLEKKSGSASTLSTPVQAPKSSGTTNSSSVSPQLGVDPQASTLLLLIQDWPHIVHNGWIFYWNKENDRQYMIRENGTDKKDIYNLFKYYPKKFISVVENGTDWIIKYDPGNGEKHVAVIHMS